MSDTTLTPRERALIRNEFLVRFGQAPQLESSILVKRWVTGLNKGQPKPGTGIQGMLDHRILGRNAFLFAARKWENMKLTHFFVLAYCALAVTACATRELPPNYETATLEQFDCEYLRALKVRQDYETWTVTKDSQRIPKLLTSQQKRDHEQVSIVFYQKRCRM